jgi:hypothetical protein
MTTDVVDPEAEDDIPTVNTIQAATLVLRGVVDMLRNDRQGCARKTTSQLASETSNDSASSSTSRFRRNTPLLATGTISPHH